ncbi:MAG: HU family DNA-binding protein [Chloroflexi bacterium]|nr:HU family DNA-binding protein [Chloroflexota bacterium]
MATQIQAYVAYGPRVELGNTVQTRQIAEYIASRTSLNRGEIENVLRELNEAITFFTKQGAAVKLEGVGTFTPSINLEGMFDVGFRLDTSIDGALNVPGAFTGNIRNGANIGKTNADLKSIL